MELWRDSPVSVTAPSPSPPDWIVGVIAVAFVGFGYGAASDNEYSGGDSDSAKAQVLIEKVIADLDASPIAGPVASPYQDEDLVTEDRRIALRPSR
jgi:RND superfamily putative drug exporter